MVTIKKIHITRKSNRVTVDLNVIDISDFEETYFGNGAIAMISLSDDSFYALRKLGLNNWEFSHHGHGFYNGPLKQFIDHILLMHNGAGFSNN